MTTATDDDPRFWVLGFTYEAVIDAWQDARLAAAIERVWVAAARPAEAEVFWMASADEYAFRWYLSPAIVALLERAQVVWRSFVIDRVATPPRQARSFLCPPIPMPDGGLGS